MKKIMIIFCLLNFLQTYSQDCSTVNMDTINSNPAFMHNLHNCMSIHSTQSGIDSCMDALYPNIPANCLNCYIGVISSACVQTNCITQCSGSSYGTSCQTCIEISCSSAIATCMTTGIINHDYQTIIFKVSPNPAAAVLTIDSPQKSTIELLDKQGQTIMQQIIRQGQTDINISGLTKGVYILILYSNDKTAVTKIVKE